MSKRDNDRANKKNIKGVRRTVIETVRAAVEKELKRGATREEAINAGLKIALDIVNEAGIGETTAGVKAMESAERVATQVANSIKELPKREKSGEETVDALWKDICETVIKLNEARNENLIDTWLFIRESKTNETKDAELTVIDEQIIKMIDAEIETLKSERDEDYFREVEYVTGFRYLMEDALVAQAGLGHSDRKFTLKENYDRFCDLRKKIREIGDEALAIDILLKDPNTDEVTKRILSARQNEIEQRKPKKVTEDELATARKREDGR